METPMTPTLVTASETVSTRKRRAEVGGASPPSSALSPKRQKAQRRRRWTAAAAAAARAGRAPEGSGEESVEVDEGEDAEEEGDHATQVEPPVRPEETLVHQAEDLVRHEEEKAGGEGERAGEEGGDEGVDLVVHPLAQLMLQELMAAHEKRPRRTRREKRGEDHPLEGRGDVDDAASAGERGGAQAVRKMTGEGGRRARF